MSKCIGLPGLLYGFEACSLTKSELSYIFMKLFKTNNIDVVESCQSFDFSLPSDLWASRNNKLDINYITW